MASLTVYGSTSDNQVSAGGDISNYPTVHDAASGGYRYHLELICAQGGMVRGV